MAALPRATTTARAITRSVSNVPLRTHLALPFTLHDAAPPVLHLKLEAIVFALSAPALMRSYNVR